MAKKGRALPTHSYTHQVDSFDQHLVTVVDPATPPLVRAAISPGCTGGSP